MQLRKKKKKKKKRDLLGIYHRQSKRKGERTLTMTTKKDTQDKQTKGQRQCLSKIKHNEKQASQCYFTHCLSEDWAGMPTASAGLPE